MSPWLPQTTKKAVQFQIPGFAKARKFKNRIVDGKTQKDQESTPKKEVD